MVVLIFNKAIREGRILVLGGLTSFLVFAFFSYPLRYIGVWVSLLFYILQFLPSKKISIKNTAKVIFMRIAITLTCISLIFITYGQIRNEIKWKDIAISSLKGSTNEMLPEYEKLYLTSSLKKNPFFLYNYGAELNASNQFAESNVVLKECKKKLNNFDLQMLIADNYYKLDKFTKAIEVYNNAHDMIPSRFLPLYYIFEIYRESGQVDLATKLANEIVDKKVKVPSSLISLIKSEASKYIENNT